MLKLIFSNIWSMFCGTCGIGKILFQRLMRLAYIVIIIMSLNTLHTLMSSGLEGDVEVWTIDPVSNKRVLFRVTGRKTLPPSLALNILSINFNHELDRQVDFKRHVYSLGGINLYAGGGLSQSTIKGTMNTKYHLGVSVTF